MILVQVALVKHPRSLVDNLLSVGSNVAYTIWQYGTNKLVVHSIPIQAKNMLSHLK